MADELTSSDKPGRRTNQVKVTLNDSELALLDELVERSGTDRATVFRTLLSNASTEESTNPGQHKVDALLKKVSTNSRPPLVFLSEPRHFDEMPLCIDALKEGNVVSLNLTMMEAFDAQRAVDFVAGGAYALEGHQERIGESIFLFAVGLDVKNLTPGSLIRARVSEINDSLGENSPSRPPLLSAQSGESSDSKPEEQDEDSEESAIEPDNTSPSDSSSESSGEQV